MIQNDLVNSISRLLYCCASRTYTPASRPHFGASSISAARTARKSPKVRACVVCHSSTDESSVLRPPAGTATFCSGRQCGRGSIDEMTRFLTTNRKTGSSSSSCCVDRILKFVTDEWQKREHPLTWTAEQPAKSV